MITYFRFVALSCFIIMSSLVSWSLPFDFSRVDEDFHLSLLLLHEKVMVLFCLVISLFFKVFINLRSILKIFFQDSILLGDVMCQVDYKSYHYIAQMLFNLGLYHQVFKLIIVILNTFGAFLEYVHLLEILLLIIRCHIPRLHELYQLLPSRQVIDMILTSIFLHGFPPSKCIALKFSKRIILPYKHTRCYWWRRSSDFITSTLGTNRITTTFEFGKTHLHGTQTSILVTFITIPFPSHALVPTKAFGSTLSLSATLLFHTPCWSPPHIYP